MTAPNKEERCYIDPKRSTTHMHILYAHLQLLDCVSKGQWCAVVCNLWILNSVSVDMWKELFRA